MIAITIDKKDVLKKETLKLIATWSLLKKEEMYDVKNFLEWRFPREKAPEVDLYKSFRQAIYKETQERINGRNLLHHLFPSIPEEKALKKLGSLLEKLEETLLEYISHTEMSKNPFIQSRALIEGLKKRGDTALFTRESKKFHKVLKEAPSTIMRKSDTWWLSHQEYFHQYTNQHTPEKHLFEPAFRHLLSFFELTFMRYYCEQLNRNNLMKSELKQEFDRVAALFSPQEQEEPVLRLYRLAAGLLSHRADQSQYIRFKSGFEQYNEQLAEADKLVLLKYGLNAAFFLYEYGVENMTHEMFYWARTGVEKRIFFFENVISDDEFINVVLSAAAGGEFKRQLDFIEICKPYLNESVRDKACLLAMAYYHFYREDYTIAVDLLLKNFPQYSQHELKYTLRAKSLLVCCYLTQVIFYDHDPLEFEKTIENLRKFVSREDILSEEKQTPFLNFIRICKGIYNLHFNELGGKADKQKGKQELLQKLEKSDRTTSKYWLRNLITKL